MNKHIVHKVPILELAHDLIRVCSHSPDDRYRANFQNINTLVLRKAGTMDKVQYNRFYHLQDLSEDSSVGIATGYGLDDRWFGVRVPVGSRIFFSPRRPDRLWGPLSLLSIGYRSLFRQGKSGRGVKLTTHLQLVPR
jgi:hypothetical protein